MPAAKNKSGKTKPSAPQQQQPQQQQSQQSKPKTAPAAPLPHICTVGPEIIKSPHDKRRYRQIKLSNDLHCLLIAEPNAKPKSSKRDNVNDTDDTAATTQDSDQQPAIAAMSVKVGHFSDTDAVKGLAHFCEHLLFMGTEKVS